LRLDIGERGKKGVFKRSRIIDRIIINSEVKKKNNFQKKSS